MKRLIAALGLTVVALSASAAEYGRPFEQVDLDRALPNLPAQAVQYASTAGSSRSDASSAPAESPWANDHNFIAPAQ